MRHTWYKLKQPYNELLNLHATIIMDKTASCVLFGAMKMVALWSMVLCQFADISLAGCQLWHIQHYGIMKMKHPSPGSPTILNPPLILPKLQDQICSGRTISWQNNHKQPDVVTQVLIRVSKKTERIRTICISLSECKHVEMKQEERTVPRFKQTRRYFSGTHHRDEEKQKLLSSKNRHKDSTFCVMI